MTVGEAVIARSAQRRTLRAVADDDQATTADHETTPQAFLLARRRA